MGIVVAFAVVFGLVAGAVFQGVNYISACISLRRLLIPRWEWQAQSAEIQ